MGTSGIVKSKIVCSLEWAAILILYNDDTTKNALKMTIGHELAHQEGHDIETYKYHSTEYRFVSWVNEVHADFRATEIMQTNKDILLQSIMFKRERKRKDNGSQTHPSWGLRYEYANQGVFGRNLIKVIAADVKCNNEDLIEKVSNHFDEIRLQ